MSATLRSSLGTGRFVLAPGVFEMLSARIADRMGYEALYLSGRGISSSHLGLLDKDLVTYRDMVERARTIAQGVSKPLIADAGAGFGGLGNVRETVRGYEAAGVQAIQLDDRELPGIGTEATPLRVLQLEEALKRIDIALAARASPDFLLIARTDARAPHGLSEAIRRGKAYARVGADIVYIEGPQSDAEFSRIGAELASDTWLLASIEPENHAPAISADKLKEYGYSIAIYPGVAMAAACAAMDAALHHLELYGNPAAGPVPSYDREQLDAIFGFAEAEPPQTRRPSELK